MAEKKEAALLAQNDPKEKTAEAIISAFSEAVKQNDLRRVMDIVNIAPKEVVKLLGQRFPSFDKTVLSKCVKPEKYGCVLHPDGYSELGKAIGVPQETQETPAAPRRRSGKSHHKFTCRVAGRLPDDKFQRLQRYIRMEGWETTQDWVTAQVDAFIRDMERKYGDAI